MFFDDWDSIFRIVLISVAAHSGLIAMLRISGKRTLSKLNAFDLVITVALGSTLATIILSKETTLVDGLTALGMLVFMQFVVTSLSARSNLIDGLVKNEPTLLAYRGQLLRAAMRKERITEEEINQTLRKHGSFSLDDVDAVILETDGHLTLIANASPSEKQKLVNRFGGNDLRKAM